MKKNLSIIILSIILVFCITMLIVLGISNQDVIESYYAKVDIDSSGNVYVKETITLDFNDKNEYWRDIKYNKNHRLNPLFNNVSSNLYEDDEPILESYSIVSVMKDGVDVTNKVVKKYSSNGDKDKYGDPVECYPYSNSCESMYIDATNINGLDGEFVITYEYRILGMVTQYKDISELNYRLFDNPGAKIKKAYVEVFLPTLPDGLNENNFYAYGHGVSRGEIVQDVFSKQEGIIPDFLFEASNVKADEFLEIRILMPNSVISSIKNDYKVDVLMFDKIKDYEGNLTRESNIKYYTALAINIGTVCLVVFTIILMLIIYKKYDKEYESPFDGEYYRELPNDMPPAHMSYMYRFGKTVDEDVTATLLNLIRKKVFILDDNGAGINDDDPNFKIKLTSDLEKVNNVIGHEKVVINWFINMCGNGSEVTFEDIREYPKKGYTQATQFQEKAREFKKTIHEECKKVGFFEKGVNKAKAKLYTYSAFLIVLAVTVAFTGLILSIEFPVNLAVLALLIIVYSLYVTSIKKRTYYWNEQYTKWKAFKKFLCEFSNFEDYPIPSIVVWEEYLPYATSLKISDKVMEQLKVKLPEYDEDEMPSTYMYTYYKYRTRNYFVYSLNHSFRSARYNASSTIASHNMSKSGGGHGGGFSGGSSFGGGGGGMRSR